MFNNYMIDKMYTEKSSKKQLWLRINLTDSGSKGGKLVALSPIQRKCPTSGLLESNV